MARAEQQNGYGGFDEGDAYYYGGDPLSFKSVFGGISKVGKALGKIPGVKRLASAIPGVGLITTAAGVIGGGLALAKGIKKQKLGRLAIPGASTMPMLPPGIAGPIDEMQTGPMPGTGIQVQFPQLPFGTGGGGVQIGQFGPGPQPGAPVGQALVRCGAGAAVKPAHLNKSGYFVFRRPVAGYGPTYVPAGSRCVANRRMNPLNPRALSKAMTRLTSAKRASKMIGRISVRGSCAPRRGAPRAKAKACKCR
jgi:hypothetical protein